MSTIKRDDIRIISKYTNLTEKGIAKALEEQVYHNGQVWQRFFRLLFISLGIGFTLAGIIFFFAYNWATLDKFIKIGLIASILVIAVIVALYVGTDTMIGNILLLAASVLTGVLFAVFGQVYQTGANAYDFFLAWTIFVTIWVIVSSFAPLALLYLFLINTTVLLYAEQVAANWSIVLVYMLLFFINTAALVIGNLFPVFKRAKPPVWLLYTIALAATSYATLGMILGIMRYQPAFPVLTSAVIILFAGGLWYGWKFRKLFYLTVIPFAVIIIISALLMKISEDAGMLLLLSIFILGSVTLMIKLLINLQKNWANENQG